MMCLNGVFHETRWILETGLKSNQIRALALEQNGIQ